MNWALSSLSLPPSLLQSHGRTQSAPSHPPSPRFFYLECAPATSRGAEHVAFLPHALDVSYAVGDHGQIHSSGARGSRLLVLSLLRQSGGFKLENSRGCVF